MSKAARGTMNHFTLQFCSLWSHMSDTLFGEGYFSLLAQGVSDERVYESLGMWCLFALFGVFRGKELMTFSG